jgi:DNA-binding transcriptional LysR family regulator
MIRALPPLRLLAAFSAVVRTGSVQAAAAELNVTQPAISQAVRQLEDHVGVPLLDRGSRPARPTEAGQTLAMAIADGLGRITDTLDALRLADSQRGRTVTVACSVGVATYWLMPRLSAFYRVYPELLVNVMTTQSGVPALIDGVDLSIRYGHGRWSDGVVHHLFDEEVEPVCTPSLRARFEGPVPPASVSLLHVRSAEPSWVTWPEYLRATGQPAVRTGGQTFTNYVQTTQAALEGHGMMLGWRSITGALVASGTLVSAGLPVLAPRDAFHLVVRSKRGGEASETFARWLLSHAGTEYGPAAKSSTGGGADETRAAH